MKTDRMPKLKKKPANTRRSAGCAASHGSASSFRDGYPFQVWHSVSTWSPDLGMCIHSHCATLAVAEEQVANLRRYKIQGERGLTRRNYHGRITIRRQNADVLALMRKERQ